MYMSVYQGGQRTWNNLEFDNLGKKKWRLRNFENNLEKPGISCENHGVTWNFFNLNVLTN